MIRLAQIHTMHSSQRSPGAVFGAGRLGPACALVVAIAKGSHES
jgi:hypothetical protein